MKPKHLIMVSLMLAILTVGAVSASDDIISNDTLEADDEAADLAETPEDDVLSDDDYEGVELTVVDEVDTDLNEYSWVASVYDPDLGGEVSLSIDNTQYFKKTVTHNDADSESGTFFINFKDLKLPNTYSGKHNVVLTYLKTGASNSKTKQGLVEFKYYPDVNFAEEYAVGELAVIGIKSLPGYSGTATLYNYDDVNKKGSAVQTISISDGFGNFVLTGLAKGSHSYVVDITINGQQFMDYSYPGFTVLDNTPGFSSGVSANEIIVGKGVTVSLNGPKSEGEVYIYVDGKEFKRLSFTSGAISEAIPSSLLPGGKHYITVHHEIYDGEDINSFYSNTFEVTVNAPVKDAIKLTLKKVTVKKSAKNLVLKATLKINKKSVKGKKLTFKFNGKTYKAKTNKKGVAKVTIKKSVLKKLKVGKKVKYQVSYGKKTVKRTAKVKK
jgi:hypothetical protein